jgi:hypothetical protein
MLYVGAKDKICFRLIGSKRFCRKPGCTIKSHKNKKFAIGTSGGWFIAAKSNQMKDPSAFVRPFLDVNKITENTTLTQKNPLSQRTTALWEVFIAEAQEEWEEEQAVGVLDDIHEDSGSSKDSKDNRSEDVNEGDLHLAHPPVAFTWAYELKSGDVSLKDKLEAGTPSDTKEAVEELHATVGDLKRMVEEAREGSRRDCLEIIQHIGLTTDELVEAIDRINRCGRRWRNEIGDMSVLRKDSGVHDLTLVNAVSKIIESLGDSRRPSKDEDVAGSLEGLARMVRAIDADLAKTYSQLNAKIKALE